MTFNYPIDFIYTAQRVYSSKTRIKTERIQRPRPVKNGLKEYIPVKQGLRLAFCKL